MKQNRIKMKKLLKNISILALTISLTACDVLDEAMKNIPTTGTTAGLSNGEVISGLKEALTVGIKNSVNMTAVTDGFLKNDLIKLPFPSDALAVKEKAEEWGLGGQVDKFVLTLNRAAEEASKEALPIFMDAIKNMSIQDGFSILNNGNGAATKFLRDNTTAKLTDAFAPKVAEAISKVKLTEIWSPIVDKYNVFAKFSGKNQVNPDLNKYVTERAITGLFSLVEIEENKIRQDPAARVSDILAKVFGSIKN